VLIRTLVLTNQDTRNRTMPRKQSMIVGAVRINLSKVVGRSRRSECDVPFNRNSKWSILNLGIFFSTTCKIRINLRSMVQSIRR
jgi:hypothetical protein